jgi:uncharacterized protein (DUF488 family)
MTNSNEPTIHTIGHGAGAFSDLEQRLGAHHVQTIVDVRSIPYSKHAPDFQKARIAAIAAATGFGYRWLGDRLGGRPDDPSLLTADGEPDYDKIAAAPAFNAGLDEVEALARTSRVALLCSELDPSGCHRMTLLAPALEARGYHIAHILGDGSSRAHQPGLGI